MVTLNLYQYTPIILYRGNEAKCFSFKKPQTGMLRQNVNRLSDGTFLIYASFPFLLVTEMFLVVSSLC